MGVTQNVSMEITARWMIIRGAAGIEQFLHSLWSSVSVACDDSKIDIQDLICMGWLIDISQLSYLL